MERANFFGMVNISFTTMWPDPRADPEFETAQDDLCNALRSRSRDHLSRVTSGGGPSKANEDAGAGEEGDKKPRKDRRREIENFISKYASIDSDSPSKDEDKSSGSKFMLAKENCLQRQIEQLHFSYYAGHDISCNLVFRRVRGGCAGVFYRTRLVVHFSMGIPGELKAPSKFVDLGREGVGFNISIAHGKIKGDAEMGTAPYLSLVNHWFTTSSSI